MAAEHQVVAAASGAHAAEADLKKLGHGVGHRREAARVASGPRVGQHGEHERYGSDGARVGDACDEARAHAKAGEGHGVEDGGEAERDERNKLLFYPDPLVRERPLQRVRGARRQAAQQHVVEQLQVVL